MGKILTVPPVKLITGFIFQEENVLGSAQDILKNKFGRIDFESPVLPFTFTSYYDFELGKGLKRKFIGFRKLIKPEALAKIKITTNRIEATLAVNKKRRINIDPGYLDLAKVVLASTKDYTHRIYLQNGIFAEVTLCYKDKGFRGWDWTYPDYRTSGYITIFNQIRQIYARQIK